MNLFWLVFWLLNGLDKFFNGPMWFGVTRHEQFKEYFARFDLPGWSAVGTTYVVGAWELALAVMFALALFLKRRTREMQPLALQGSLLLFTCFVGCDILLGDRGELWEHSTYVLVVLMSWHVLRH